MKKKKIAICICSVVILFLIFKKFTGKDEKTIFLTDEVKRGNIAQTVIATGTIRSNNRVEVGAQVSGRITKLNVVLGQEVKKGDLIATISGVSELEELIKQAKIEVKIAETDLSYTVITSPIDGVVVSIPISEGQTVNSMQSAPTIVQVADLKKMLIKPEISEGDITKLKKGQEVEFTILSLPEKVYKAKIDSIDPATTTLTDDEYEESASDTEAVYYYANVIVDNKDNNLRIGMTTTNTIKVAEAKDVITIPTTALYKKGNKYYVKTLGEKEEVEEKEVKIGINDDMNTEIKSGLKEGEKLILTEMKAGEVASRSTRPPRF
ncbi:MAG: efflux RND transporter periplasmic adaptor subunit [Fusobacterium sp.]